MLTLKSCYGSKPALLLCPAAVRRRTLNPGPAEGPVDPQSSSVVANGGPTTATDFPTIDTTLPANAVNPDLIASYGENCWV